MEPINDAGSNFYLTLQTMWSQIGLYLPQILVAVIVLIIGLIAAVALGKAAEKLAAILGVDRALTATGTQQKLQQYNIRYTLKDILGWAVRWFFYLVTLVTVADILNIPQLTDFLVRVLYFIPNVIIAVIMIMVGILAARFVGDIIAAGLNRVSLTPRAGRVILTVARSVIIIFAVMAALIQIGIAASLIQILFAGLVTMLAIAGGLAFGLGGQERAHDLLNRAANTAGEQAKRAV